MGVVSGSNTHQEVLVTLGTTDLPPDDHSTPAISVMSAAREVTTPMTVTATAGGAGGAGNHDDHHSDLLFESS